MLVRLTPLMPEPALQLARSKEPSLHFNHYFQYNILLHINKYIFYIFLVPPIVTTSSGLERLESLALRIPRTSAALDNMAMIKHM